MDERRSEPRFLCSDLITAQIENQRRKLTVVLEDISSSGACFEVDRAVPVDATLLLRCGGCCLRGKVRYCVSRETGYQVGVEFAGGNWSKYTYEPEHLLDSLPVRVGDQAAVPGATADAPAALRSSHTNPDDWVALVKRIQAGDDTAEPELYSALSRALRFSIWRQLGPQDPDDVVHDVFIVAVDAIRTGRLDAPECLLGYVQKVTRNHIAGHIRERIRSRQQSADAAVQPDHAAPIHPGPEQALLSQERIGITRQALNRLRHRDREILRRFYVLAQTPEQICREMHLTADPFRLTKSRAKATFGKIDKRIMQPQSSHSRSTQLNVAPTPLKVRSAGSVDPAM